MYQKIILALVRTSRHALRMLLLLVFLTAASTSGISDTKFDKSTLPASKSVELKLVKAQKASKVQSDRYRAKLAKLRTHHLPLRTLIAQVPFSNTISQNKRDVKRRDPALFSDGLEVQNNIPVSERAAMNYDWVSPVAEPSSAISGKNILVTFNWGAAWSEDGGKTFSQLDPYDLFATPPPPLGDEFCCDQLALYVKSHKLMLWLMQGTERADGGNSIRLLFAKEADVGSRQWHAHDFTPSGVGGWTGEWFDYPDMAVSDRHLFISFNSFKGGGGFERSVVMRFPLDELASYGVVNVSAFSDDTDFSPRFTQGAKEQMFWAVHKDTAALRVRTWADSEEQPRARKLVPVERYVIPDEASVKGSEGPNSRPWLNRLDDRITAGWATDETVGFAWASALITPAPGRAAYPHPHVRVAIVPKAQLLSGPATLPRDAVDEPHIWNSTVAMVYAAAAPNNEGTVGLSLYFGGKKHFPSAAIGVLRKQGGNWNATLTVLATGKNSPRCKVSGGFDDECGAFGDYIHVRPQLDDPKGWYVAVHSPQDKGDVKPKVEVTLGLYKLKGAVPLAAGPQSLTNRVGIKRPLVPGQLQAGN